MSVSASEEVEQGEALVADGKSESALRHNIRTKGNNAYYYAHGREFSVPEDAIIRKGPGIITGGEPTLIGTSPKPVSESEISCKTPSTRFPEITKYQFVDAPSKVEVIIELPGEEITDVECEYEEKTLGCVVSTSNGKKQLWIGALFGSIVPGDCAYRVSKGKPKVTIILVKTAASPWSRITENRT